MLSRPNGVGGSGVEWRGVGRRYCTADRHGPLTVLVTEASPTQSLRGIVTHRSTQQPADCKSLTLTCSACRMQRRLSYYPEQVEECLVESSGSVTLQRLDFTCKLWLALQAQSLAGRRSTEIRGRKAGADDRWNEQPATDSQRCWETLTLGSYTR